MTDDLPKKFYDLNDADVRITVGGFPLDPIGFAPEVGYYTVLEDITHTNPLDLIEDLHANAHASLAHLADPADPDPIVKLMVERAITPELAPPGVLSEQRAMFMARLFDAPRAVFRTAGYMPSAKIADASIQSVPLPNLIGTAELIPIVFRAVDPSRCVPAFRILAQLGNNARVYESTAWSAVYLDYRNALNELVLRAAVDLGHEQAMRELGR